MGFSLKKIGNIAGKVAGGALGFATGGPAGAVMGVNGANTVLGAVGLGDDQLAAAENWKWQKKASDYAFNQNLQMWNLQNAYNDPSAQMERLQKAGLNPNLVYGGGNVSGNTAGSAPSYERPNVSYQDRQIQREQLQLALQEHQQRVTNQAIENDLARQRLVLSERASNREDALAQAQIAAYGVNMGLTRTRIRDIESGPKTWFGRVANDIASNWKRLVEWQQEHKRIDSRYDFVGHKELR
uniref:DNA pilot protein n=1 Tax=Dulem virus 98 TaxID=3145809 RepID=A0AAU8B9S6_9VIRU